MNPSASRESPLKVEVLCPNCKRPLEINGDAYACPACRETYPLIDDIPLLFDKTRMAQYRTSKGTTQEYYRNVAKNYAQTHHVSMPGARYFLNEFETNLKRHLGDARRVLEIGAGTGFATAAILRNVAPLTVTDASLEMLMVNLSNHPGLKAFCCATENLPFPDEAFDAVIGNNTFYLVPDKREGAGNLARILRKGGRLILSEMNPNFLLWPLMFAATNRFFERTIYQIFPFQMKRLFSPFGLELERVDYYSYTPYFAGEKLSSLGKGFEKTFGRSRLIRRFSAVRIFYLFKKT